MVCPRCAAPVKAAARSCSNPACDQVFTSAFWQAVAGETQHSAAAEHSKEGIVLKGRYALETVLGHGGMGHVFRARDLALGREVAVKFLASDRRADPAAVLRFLREGRALAAADHPNVVSIYDVGDEAEAPWLAMRLVPGIDLSFRLQTGGPLSLNEGVDIGCQLCDALGHLHERGLIHRDVKPRNIMLEPSGRCVLLDLGVTRSIADTETHSDAGIGTAAYMAPEQAYGTATVDGRADLYSLGITLFELWTGERPFVADSAYSLMEKHRDAEIPPASARRADLPAAVDAFIRRAIAKTPNGRFHDARAMKQGLIALGETSPGVTSTAEVLRRLGRGRRRALAVSAVATVVLCLGIAWSWTTLLGEAGAPSPSSSASDAGDRSPLPIVAALPTRRERPAPAVSPTPPAQPPVAPQATRRHAPAPAHPPRRAARADDSPDEPSMADDAPDAPPEAPSARAAIEAESQEPRPSTEGAESARGALTLARREKKAEAPTTRGSLAVPPDVAPGPPAPAKTGVLVLVIRDALGMLVSANVSINGEAPIEDSVIRRALPAGTHHISVSRARYRSTQLHVDLPAGGERRESLTLHRLGPR